MERFRPIAPAALAGLCILTASAVLYGTTVHAQTQRSTTVLQSGGNDIVRLQKGGAPDPSVQIAPSQPQAAAPAAKKRHRTTAPKIGNLKTGRRVPQALQNRGVRAAPQNAQPTAGSFSGQTTNRFAVPQGQSVGGAGAKAPAIAPAAPPEATRTPSPPPAAEAAVTAQPPPIDAETAARLVTICLINEAASSGAKAFDIRRDAPPRYVAQPGEQICARFEPTRQTLFLWKADDRGNLALTLSNRLDLSGAAGTQVTLNWIQG